MGSFGKAFGTSSGCLSGILAVIIGLPVLACGGCLVFFGGLGVVASKVTPDAQRTTQNSVTSTSTEQTPPAPANEPIESRPTERGAICSLSMDGPVFLSADEKTNDRLTDLCLAKDETGILQLILDGRVAVVASGTLARIITPGILTVEVRILDGEAAGISGIVDAEAIHKPAKSAPIVEATPRSIESEPPPTPQQATEPKPELPAKFTVYFVNGKSKPIAGYDEDDAGYVISGTKGGKTRYAKSMIDRIEPIAAEQPEQTSDGFRTWTDAAGTHHVEAEFVAIENGNVKLRKKNGKTVELPLEKLSDEDKKVAKELEAARTK